MDQLSSELAQLKKNTNETLMSDVNLLKTKIANLENKQIDQSLPNTDVFLELQERFLRAKNLILFNLPDQNPIQDSDTVNKLFKNHY